jgi:hypothetical protein
MTSHPCTRCGKPTDIFHTASWGDRIYTCTPCRQEGAKEALLSGKYDDLVMTIKWPDGTETSATGRKLRSN